MHRIIKAAGTCFAAATIALILAPTAGAAAIPRTPATSVTSVTTGAGYHHHCGHRCWRHWDDEDGDYHGGWGGEGSWDGSWYGGGWGGPGGHHDRGYWRR